jgi:AcrR family transcriptional regulator
VSTTTTPSRPHRARRGEGERLRDEILDATEAMLIESGDAATISIRRVAHAVGRTPPSIYLHFATKDELMQAVCQRRFDALTERFALATDGVDDPVERIRQMARAYVEFALAHPEHYRLLFMSGTRSQVQDLDGLRLTDCFGMLHTAVEDALARDLFAPADPTLVALALWSAVHGTASLLIAQDLDFPPLDAYLGQVVQQNLAGLLAR